MAVPKTFTGGERLFAEDLNGNFEALDTRLASAEFDIDTNAANLNASNLVSGTVPAARFPAGSIIQTQTLYFTDAFFRSSFADSTPIIIPGFTLSITPTSASNKILVMTKAAVSPANSESFSVTSRRTIGNGEESFNHHVGRLVRAQTSVFEAGHALTDYSMAYLDSPNTTETVTYQVYVNSSGAGDQFGVNRAVYESDRFGASSIVLMEVVA